MFFKSYMGCHALSDFQATFPVHVSCLMRPGSLAGVRPVGNGISRDLHIFPSDKLSFNMGLSRPVVF